ncbi:MAG: hypothetical protein ING89_15370 [Rubrivivax sp.]|nr:hypothetical protein [Rubrivivax sp.]
MDICVVVRSADSLEQAGTRIRYQRLQPPLAALGHRLTIESIDSFRSANQLVHDVYWLSKCHDARAQVLAHLAAGAGKPLGLDLFDDSFNPAHDSRLRADRQWLRAMAPALAFVSCSTPTLEEFCRSAMPQTRLHRMPDPADAIEPATLQAQLQTALERAHSSRRIDLAWFGMGDHPQHPVGLQDLHAFAWALAPLRDRGWQPVLRVLTNRRALTTAAMERLARLPLPWSLQEWSLEGEAQLLQDSLVSFLPVNAQPFSRAKSLNRAVTALAAGTQVLSVGHALYTPLHDFVYRDAKSLIDDITLRQPKLREATVPAMQSLLEGLCGAQGVARALVGFLQQLPRPAVARRGRLAVVHGLRSDKPVHEMAQRSGQLSVASPMANPGLNYDLRFVRVGAGVEAQFGEPALAELKRELKTRLRPAVSPTGRAVQALDLAPLAPLAAQRLADVAAATSQAQRLAVQAGLWDAMQEVLALLLPEVRWVASESEPGFGLGLAA